MVQSTKALNGNALQHATAKYFLIKLLLGLVIAETFVFKSVLETPLGSTLTHYVVSAALCALLIIAYVTTISVRYLYLGTFVRVTIVLLIAWSVSISFMHTPTLENVIAALLFALLIVMFFRVIPLLAEFCGIRCWQMLYAGSIISVVLSLLGIFATPWLVFDEGGRFNGVLVSTAVSSNVFFFAVVFAAASMWQSRSSIRTLAHLLAVIASVGCLLLTGTRGHIAFAVIALVWIGLWKARYTLLHKVVAVSVILGVVGIVWLVGTGAIPKTFEGVSTFLRLEERAITDSRMANWIFGFEQATNSPIVGEGFLAKYTSGGTETFGGTAENTYDQLYDPHSVVLYLLTVGGVPTLFLTGSLVVRVWWCASRSMKYMPAIIGDQRILYMTTLLLGVLMIPTGGSLVSFGNLVDRVWWLLLGELYLRSQRKGMQ